MQHSRMMLASFLLFALGVLGQCGETTRTCSPCVDDYKTKCMPPQREYFCPNGCDPYKMKSCVPTKPYFVPNGCDDYKYKTIPCFKPNTLGICYPDNGTGINWWGLRPRPDTSHPQK